MSRYALARRQEFQPYCPSGGQWYACEAGSRFVGCCDDDPCSIRGCNQGNLKPASFNPAHHGTFPDLECNSGNWYTCNGTSPPFMGCCKSNACAQGCPTEDLAAGHMGNNEALASQFYTEESPSTSSKSSTRAIVGGAVGGVAGLIILASLLFYYYRHAAKSRKAWSSGVDVRNSQNSEKVGNGATDVSEASGHYQGLPIPIPTQLKITSTTSSISLRLETCSR